MISGYVYALRPFQGGSVRAFLGGKARRVLLPWLTVTAVTFALRLLLPANHPLSLADLPRVFLFRFEHLWFLQAIFLAFVAIVAIENRRWIRTPLGWTMTLGAAYLAWHVLPHTSFLSLKGFLYLMPYFLLGVGLCRFEERLRGRAVVTTAAVALAIGVTVHQCAWFGAIERVPGPGSLVALSIGMGGSLLLFRFRRPVASLATLGAHAFPIYLFHMLAIAVANRVVPSAAGEPLAFAARVVAGLALPVGIEAALGRLGYARLLFLGLRPSPRLDSGQRVGARRDRSYEGAAGPARVTI